jgi:ABC-2 type transport system permease protein
MKLRIQNLSKTYANMATISPEDRLIANGTFLDGTGVYIGYQPGGELEDDDVRQRNQLKTKERVPRLNDQRGLMTCGFIPDADYVRFETTVSTDPAAKPRPTRCSTCCTTCSKR